MLNIGWLENWAWKMIQPNGIIILPTNYKPILNHKHFIRLQTLVNAKPLAVGDNKDLAQEIITC